MINDPKDVSEEVPLSTKHITKTDGQPVKLSVADKNSNNKLPQIKKNTNIKTSHFVGLNVVLPTLRHRNSWKFPLLKQV